MRFHPAAHALLLSLAIGDEATHASVEQDQREVARLDVEYQAAVARNDATAMDRILHEDMVLVLGDGRVFTRAELVREARDQSIRYEQQSEDAGTQVVRVWGDTAVVTARLWVKGRSKAGDFDRRLWFSDTYIRTPDGWKYVFGQASLALPPLSPADASARPQRGGVYSPVSSSCAACTRKM